MARVRQSEYLDAQAQRAWEHAQAMGTFTLYTLSASSHISHEFLQPLIPVWRREGRITFKCVGKRRRKYWTVAINPVPIALPKATPEQNMWRTARNLSSFTVRDIQLHASTDTVQVGEEDAASFCRMLMKAGYLTCLRKAAIGRRPAVYRLTRNTGPKPPAERRVRAIWDPNLGEYTHLPEPKS